MGINILSLRNKCYINFKLAIAFFLTVPFSAKAQKIPCDQIMYGTFYFYPSKNSDAFKIIRKDSVQIEIDLKKNDTTWFKASWQVDCVLREDYLRSTAEIPEDQLKFMKEHFVLVEVQTITDKYYSFLGSVDIDGSKWGESQDTVWFKPRRK